MARKKKIEIPGGWFPVSKDMLRSEAFKSLSGNATKAYFYFLSDKKTDCQEFVTLTFKQAKLKNLCKSDPTFLKIKKELTDKGFLDSIDGGGMGKHAIFKLSYRWKYYNTDRFEELKYKKGFCASKDFRKRLKSS